jgi:hypothetical protein
MANVELEDRTMFRFEKRKSRKWFIALWLLIFGFGLWARQCVREEGKWYGVYEMRGRFKGSGGDPEQPYVNFLYNRRGLWRVPHSEIFWKIHPQWRVMTLIINAKTDKEFFDPQPEMIKEFRIDDVREDDMTGLKKDDITVWYVREGDRMRTVMISGEREKNADYLVEQWRIAKYGK